MYAKIAKIKKFFNLFFILYGEGLLPLFTFNISKIILITTTSISAKRLPFYQKIYSIVIEMTDQWIFSR